MNFHCRYLCCRGVLVLSGWHPHFSGQQKHTEKNQRPCPTKPSASWRGKNKKGQSFYLLVQNWTNRTGRYLKRSCNLHPSPSWDPYHLHPSERCPTVLPLLASTARIPEPLQSTLILLRSAGIRKIPNILFNTPLLHFSEARDWHLSGGLQELTTGFQNSLLCIPLQRETTINTNLQFQTFKGKPFISNFLRNQ